MTTLAARPGQSLPGFVSFSSSTSSGLSTRTWAYSPALSFQPSAFPGGGRKPQRHGPGSALPRAAFLRRRQDALPNLPSSTGAPPHGLPMRGCQRSLFPRLCRSHSPAGASIQRGVSLSPSPPGLPITILERSGAFQRLFHAFCSVPEFHQRSCSLPPSSCNCVSRRVGERAPA